MKGLLLSAALSLVPCLAMAEPAAQTTMTIYNDNLALVDQLRPITLVAGRQRIELADVSAQIRPETVSLTAPGVTLVEQNFDFDLLTPAALMAKAVGQQVQIVRTNPGSGAQVTETATVLSANDGVVLQIGNRIEVLRDDGVPTRVIFPRVPPNLRPSPTLSVTLDAVQAGPRQARLSYLTTGLSWRADYVAVFNDQAGQLGLQGWITLTNSSGSSFDNVNARLVAGQINVSGGTSEYFQRQQAERQRRLQGAAGVEGFAAGPSDVYIYPLPERVTLANNQTKQVGFLEAAGVAGARTYRFHSEALSSDPAPRSAEVVIRFRNSAAGGLGAPLPAGIVRVYVRDQGGEPRFVGENYIGHTPQGSEVEVPIGEAFDVTVQQTLVSSTATRNLVRSGMAYLFRNARSTPVDVEFEQTLPGDARIVEPSSPGERASAELQRWTVHVPANGQTELRFSVEDPR